MYFKIKIHSNFIFSLFEIFRYKECVLVGLFGLCLWCINGCGHPNDESASRNTERVSTSGITVSQTVFDEPETVSETFQTETKFSELPTAESTDSNHEISETENEGTANRTIWGVKETTSVRSVWNRMVVAYKTAKTYRDLGEIHIYWKQNGKVHERRSVYHTNFQRPNGLLLTINQTEILANGKVLCAYTPERPGLILQKPCPKELSLEDILCDREIYWALIDVESNRFSYFPPPLLLMLAQDPLTTFLYHGESGTSPQITLLDSQEYEGRMCYRVSMLNDEGQTVFWVDSESFLLRKIDLPRQILKKDDTNEENQEEMSVSLEFHGAEFNWVGVLEMNIPTNVKVVSSYSEPQIEILGQKWSDLHFIGLDGQELTQQISGKNLFFFCWSIYSPNSFNFKDLERLYQRFKNESDLKFLAVNTDAASIPNEKVSAAAHKLGISCPLVRCTDESLMQLIQNRELFSCFLINSVGNVQFCETLSSFHSVMLYTQKIQAVLNGKEIYQEKIRELQHSELDFQNSVQQWVKNGIFLKDVNANQITISEKRISPASEPVICTLKKIWSVENLKSPTWIQPLPAQNRVLVLENGNSVIELEPNGKTSAIHHPKLPKNEFLQKIVVFDENSGTNTFLGLLGKRFYVYDDQWNLKQVFPPLTDENPGPLSDVLLEDLDGDGQPEIYAAFQNQKTIQKVILNENKIVKNETISNILQIISVMNHGKKELRIIDQTGTISVLDPQTLQIHQKQEILSRSLTSLIAYDFDADGTDSLAATAVGQNGKFKVLGINENGEELWNIDLPDYLYQRNIQKIHSFNLMTPEGIRNGWLLLGADSSVFLVESSGLLIDQFHFGKIITGCASAVLNEKPYLFFVSPDGVCAMEVER